MGIIKPKSTMKKILFLFALLLGIGISTAMASGMQPPGHDCVFSISSTEVTSNEMLVRAIMNVVSQKVAATCIFSAPNVVFHVVEIGSSGGMADWCINTREIELQPFNWNTTVDQHRMSKKDLLGCTQNKHCNILVFTINCNYKFPLI